MSDNNQTYKADSGKTRLDLVSPTFIEAVGKIRAFGVSKYGDSDSWAKVEPKRYMADLLRHINAYRMGEEIDKESGLPHLWHAACNLMFLIDLDELKAVSFGEGDTPTKKTEISWDDIPRDTPWPERACKNCEYFYKVGEQCGIKGMESLYENFCCKYHEYKARAWKRQENGEWGYKFI